nr:MAG TPA: hypothetical protein [Caudoviricetes sp.]
MAGRPYTKINQGLLNLMAIRGTKPLAESNGLIHGVVDSEETVPAFVVPLHVRDSMGVEHICVDLRKAKSEYVLDNNGTTFRPNLLTDANFLTNFGLCQWVWMRKPGLLSGLFFDAMRIYASWIGLKVAKRLMLAPPQSSEMILYFCYFWLTRYIKTEVMDEREYEQLVLRICNTFGYNVNEVRTVLDPFGKKVFSGLTDFCQTISQVNLNPKLSKFNPVFLITVLFGSWASGPNSRDYVAIGTEYPPMFMTMLYRSLNERGLKGTDVTHMANTYMNSAKQKQYNLLFADMLKRAATEGY